MYAIIHMYVKPYFLADGRKVLGVVVAVKDTADLHDTINMTIRVRVSDLDGNVETGALAVVADSYAGEMGKLRCMYP